MTTYTVTKNIIGIAILLISCEVYAVDPPFSSSGIPPYEQGLIDQLKSCAENAVGQGLNTAEHIAAQCSQEKAQLDAAIPNLSEQIITAALS